ncbi:PTS sugar transporter subunit IIA [Clostridium sp. cel8]|jgi:mannitol PTS system EIIA component|uniref:PTS sugar transporter subunit IIA n=1 Tax=Clostridium sp. cel8 TaxID=2663123 RepID=UPI0015F514B5|nr:PTS sugar transporter subunit IIA [Clostridium sp. cel8]MBA5850244.1 PTS sugar transporter subunit IIA [Clostridium sp. cel8]
MLKELLKNNITILNEVSDWKEAIKTAAIPLKEGGFINENYINAMLENVLKNGPYIVIMPGIAIPHSRPEDGVLKTGMSLLKLSKSVKFPENKDVKLLIVLAANDSDKHLKLISELTELLMEDKSVEKLFSAKSKEEVFECLC